MGRKIISWFTVVITVVLLGFGLMCWVYCMDTEEMQIHLKESQNIFSLEGDYPRIDGSESSQLDNFTDALMLLTAGYNGTESIIDKAMNNYRLTVKDKTPCESLVRIGF